MMNASSENEKFCRRHKFRNVYVPLVLLRCRCQCKSTFGVMSIHSVAFWLENLLLWFSSFKHNDSITWHVLFFPPYFHFIVFFLFFASSINSSLVGCSLCRYQAHMTRCKVQLCWICVYSLVIVIRGKSGFRYTNHIYIYRCISCERV